ncbi:MAG TPA: hypothetical protein VF644_15350 [Pyrinomonadaceae bacterium]|jgi:hypothetical protein
MVNTQTTGWIDIDLSSFKIKRTTTIRGNEVELFVSPYDIPKAVRASLDEDKRYLTIEFKYLNEEPTEDKKENNYVEYKLGKASHRLQAIKIDIDNLMKQENIKFNITKRDKLLSAINILLRKTNGESPRDNYELVQDAIRAKENEILAAAAA